MTLFPPAAAILQIIVLPAKEVAVCRQNNKEKQRNPYLGLAGQSVPSQDCRHFLGRMSRSAVDHTSDGAKREYAQRVAHKRVKNTKIPGGGFQTGRRGGNGRTDGTDRQLDARPSIVAFSQP